MLRFWAVMVSLAHDYLITCKFPFGNLNMTWRFWNGEQTLQTKCRKCVIFLYFLSSSALKDGSRVLNLCTYTYTIMVIWHSLSSVTSYSRLCHSLFFRRQIQARKTLLMFARELEVSTTSCHQGELSTWFAHVISSSLITCG